jgi:hypothetical protein
VPPCCCRPNRMKRKSAGVGANLCHKQRNNESSVMLKDTEKASPPSHQEQRKASLKRDKDSPRFNLVFLGAPLVSLVAWWFAVSRYLAT